MSDKYQHIRVSMERREENNKVGVFVKTDGSATFRVPMSNVTGPVQKVGWYASLFLYDDGVMKVRMD